MVGYLRIYKYQIGTVSLQTVDMPVGSHVICVKEQNGTLTLWAEVDTRCSTLKPVNVSIVGTGQEIDFQIGDYSYRYLDTVIAENDLVWHVYVSNG